MENFHERKYYYTLVMIFLKATKDIFPDAEVIIQNALNKGIFFEINKRHKLSKSDVDEIRNKMDEIIAGDHFINEICRDCEVLKRMSDTLKREDITRLLDNSGWINLKEYELNGYVDYFPGKLYDKTGAIHLYEIEKYKDGILIKYPLKDNPHVIPQSPDNTKMAKIFEESSSWHKIMDVQYVGALNEKIIEGDVEELIRINEVLHQIKLSKIAEAIVTNHRIKVITIAGPSSSGKTTFGKRLALHLRALEAKPILVSADNYYKNRDEIPLDATGNKDFEDIEALDLELINSNLMDLIEGKEVEMPEYNFYTGMREAGEKIKLPERGIIIVEGIHGLNERLTETIPKSQKFKIYISCLTQLNFDKHNRVSTTDVRKVRRLVRDSLSRGTTAEETLRLWDSVRRGEEKYIFPFQEEADTIFNSSLVYEIGVLKSKARQELVKIKVTSPYYDEAKRLINFLDYFMDIDEHMVPDDSLLKEFLGGSYFYKY